MGRADHGRDPRARCPYQTLHGLLEWEHLDLGMSMQTCCSDQKSPLLRLVQKAPGEFYAWKPEAEEPVFGRKRIVQGRICIARKEGVLCANIYRVQAGKG